MLTETSRLILRDLQHDDLADLLILSSDPEILRTNDYLPADLVKLREWLVDTLASEKQQPRNSHHSAILLKATSQVIGWIGFHLSNDPTPGRVDFGYALSPAFWNNGYMTEAVGGMLTYCFDILGVRIVTAFHMDNNPSSGRVMLKAGMRLYNEIMDDRKDGEVHFVISASDWQTKRSNIKR